MHDAFRLDSHKLYWHLDRVNAAARGEIVAPIYVEISPTDRCSHNCIFCGLDFKRGSGHALDTAKTLEAIAAMGRLGVRSINFSGEGEPLLHKDTPRFVQACGQAGIDASLATNGSVYNRDAWAMMLEHLTWVRFSVDAGSPETHARVHRGGADGFRRTENTIRRAVDIKREIGSRTTVGVQYVLLRQNRDDLEQAIRMFQDIGVDYLSIKPFSPHPLMHGDVGEPLDAGDIREVAALAASLEPRSQTRLIFRQEAFAASVAEQAAYTACRALPFWAYISSNGHVYSCFTFLGDDRFYLGDIATDGMEDILFGERRKESIRVGCEALNIEGECRTNCRMARINAFLELLACPPDHVNFI